MIWFDIYGRKTINRFFAQITNEITETLKNNNKNLVLDFDDINEIWINKIFAQQLTVVEKLNDMKIIKMEKMKFMWEMIKNLGGEINMWFYDYMQKI